MLFSQRKGHKPVSSVIQRDGMSEELRNSLWNILDLLIWRKKNFMGQEYYIETEGLAGYSTILWLTFFKKPVDSRPNSSYKILKVIRDYFFSCEWYEVYDFVEFTLSYEKNNSLSDLVNGVLEQELSAYRYVDNLFTDITDELEIIMLHETLGEKDFPGVATHLRRALELLSDRENPDYRNSIKESISAVESLAKIITGKPKATLGEALSILGKKKEFHSALLDGFSKLYGYTSDEGGIRHSMLEDPKLTASDAKFFLMSCTSFINYLKSKM